jgi:hypothetical protein
MTTENLIKEFSRVPIFSLAIHTSNSPCDERYKISARG